MTLQYAIVNFVDHAMAAWFMHHFQEFEVLSVSWNEPLQGLEAQIERYRNSPVMHESVPKDFRPALFNNGQQVVFPSPTTRVKAPRVRHQKPRACNEGADC